jgi:hypothetical protein
MNAIDYWKLCEAFSVIQAALLITGEDPIVHLDSIANDEFWLQPIGFDAILAALETSIISGKLKATIKWVTRQTWTEDDFTLVSYDTDVLDRHRTFIAHDDLVNWLSSRNFKPAFFFEQKTDAPGYLDPKHQNYSPKLAAAIRAWEAVTSDPKYSTYGKSAKTNIENWLYSHAAEFNLVKDNGEINADAIKNQIAKVANWQTDGGAPKTPSK